MKKDKFRIVSSLSVYSCLEWYHVEYYDKHLFFGGWERLNGIEKQRSYEDALKELKRYIRYIEYKPEIYEFNIEDLL